MENLHWKILASSEIRTHNLPAQIPIHLGAVPSLKVYGFFYLKYADKKAAWVFSVHRRLGWK